MKSLSTSTRKIIMLPGTDKLIPPPPVKKEDRPAPIPFPVHETFVYDPATGKHVRQW